MKRMTDYELVKYIMMTTALSAMCALIYDVLNWFRRRQEDKENKKNKENKENKENKKNDGL
jgi:predicted histidine transporter YuiF (NhaC family)